MFDPLKEGMQRSVFAQLWKILNQLVKVMQLEKCKTDQLGDIKI
jgi:hypothetical protein